LKLKALTPNWKHIAYSVKFSFV